MTEDFADELLDWYAEDDAADEAEDDEPDDDIDGMLPPLAGLPDEDYGRKFRVAPPTAPVPVARTIYRRFRTDDRLPTLVAYRGSWMQWRLTHWAELNIAKLRGHIYRTLQNAIYEHPTKQGVEIKPWNPDKRKVANVLEAMEALAHLSSDIDPPSWIGLHSAAETAAAQMISCENGLLDLSTRTLHDHTPALFNVVSVPFDYQPRRAEPPTAWLEFLASVWPDDPDSIALLQEYIGYVLSGRTDMQKMLLLIGPTRSGKGTIARMLTELIGRGNVAGPTLASLGTNFGLSPAAGQAAGDHLRRPPGQHAVATPSWSGCCRSPARTCSTVDRKYREPWSGKLPTRFVILTNELPRFRDSSGAIANRMLILQMTESFLGREDRTLDDKLRAELPAILSWALEGLDRLIRNGRFTVPRSSADAANLMMDLASPVSAFVRDCCERRPTRASASTTSTRAWKTWAEDNGHHAGSKVHVRP